MLPVPLDLKWLGHAGFLIKVGMKNIYIDPYQISSGEKKADILLITHSHYDHCSIEDINKIIKKDTLVLCPADCQSKITKLDVKMQVVEPGQKLRIDNITIKAVPAYNINKKFHSKGENWLGYIIENGKTVYHAGDTDLIPEMKKIAELAKKKRLIALLPVGGTYTMDSAEAARAAQIIKPFLAIPMHWGSIIGSKEDAEKFVELCKEKGISAKILEKE